MYSQPDRVSSCVIVGGGITGLITATILQRQGIEVTILDKGRGIGGRLAARRIQEGVFDYGAQYFSVQHPQFQPWVKEWLEAGVITEWCQQFSAEDSKKPRYRGVISNRAIAKHLAKDLTVHTSTKVTKLNYAESQWLLETEAGEQFRAEMLVMTPPVPQTLALLKSSQISLPREIKAALEKITYHPCIAVLALLDRASKIPSPGGMALEDDCLVWIADNYQKGISPQFAVTLHATPEFSLACWQDSDRAIAERMLEAASEWLPKEIIDYQVHRWRYSLARTFYAQPYCALTHLPLIVAGDAFVAPKIEGAVLSGIAAATAILDS